MGLKEVKDRDGRIKFTVREDGDRKIVKDRDGRTLGSSTSESTKDRDGRIVARGDHPDILGR